MFRHSTVIPIIIMFICQTFKIFFINDKKKQYLPFYYNRFNFTHYENSKKNKSIALPKSIV